MTKGENWTKGSWRVKNGCVYAGESIVASLGFNVRPGSDEDDANARLCASGPDLYEALVAAQDLIAPENVDERARIRVALAKARGEVQR